MQQGQGWAESLPSYHFLSWKQSQGQAINMTGYQLQGGVSCDDTQHRHEEDEGGGPTEVLWSVALNRTAEDGEGRVSLMEGVYGPIRKATGPAIPTSMRPLSSFQGQAEGFHSNRRGSTWTLDK